MPSRPTEAPFRKDSRYKPARPHPNNTRQHGNLHGLQHAASGTADVLLGIPSESLTHVTSFLAPPDLLALARTCKSLHAHVADDNTWRRAYVYQYLGITPESDLRDDGDKTLLMRREESSWKKEFILRYNLRRYVMSLLEDRRGHYFVGAHTPRGLYILSGAHHSATRSAICHAAALTRLHPGHAPSCICSRCTCAGCMRRSLTRCARSHPLPAVLRL